jgi:DNA-binding MarR family transcriptional regulator
MENNHVKHLKRIDIALSEINKMLRQGLLDEGLTGPQYGLLRILAQEPDITFTEVAKKIGIAPSAVTGLLTRLEKLSLVSRKRNEVDRRTMKVTIRPEGLVLLNKIQQKRQAILGAYFEAYQPEQIQSLANLLSREEQEANR